MDSPAISPANNPTRVAHAPVEKAIEMPLINAAEKFINQNTDFSVNASERGDAFDFDLEKNSILKRRPLHIEVI